MSFAKFLGDRHWFAGDTVTYSDFLMYEVFASYKTLDPKMLEAKASNTVTVLLNPDARNANFHLFLLGISNAERVHEKI